MSRPKKWTYPFKSTKKSAPSKEALGEFPFSVKRDNPLGSQDSTEQLGEVAATADNLTDGYDFSLTDNPVESPDVKQISVEEAGPVGAQDSSRQVSTGSNEASASGPDFSLIDNPEEDPNVGLFTVKSANQVIVDAKNRPPRRRLFGQLWFEGENNILFSDTNLGKTILAYQIANSISSGRSILGLAMEAPAQKVAYCDFELSEMQFLKRYSGDDGSIYKFSPNLLRVEIDPDAECPQGYSFEDYLKMSLEKVAVDHGVKIFVIDNITYLNNETEKASFALPMMRWLKDFRRKYDLSILILAHTPKRDPSRPITKNDLAGSRMTMNFCDASFAIGGSTKGSQIRYIKEIKQRNEPFRYDSDNVIVCAVDKLNNFLQFRFVEYGSERDHLTENAKDALIQRAKEMKAQGKTQREIAAQLGVSVGTVNNWLKK